MLATGVYQGTVLSESSSISDVEGGFAVPKQKRRNERLANLERSDGDSRNARVISACTRGRFCRRVPGDGSLVQVLL